MATTYDVIVLGIGAMGSAACHQLASRGARVLGLEQFSLVHGRGSSHGETRIIRQAYFEHPNYVPLLLRAYQLWEKLESEDAQQARLFQQVGLVLSGTSEGETIRGAKLSGQLHNLPLEDVTHAEAAQRWPALSFPADHAIVYEPKAGLLRVEACVQRQIDRAIELGAEIRCNERVLEWTSNGTSVVVRTDRDEYRAGALVIAAGAWAGQCLNTFGRCFNVLRKFVAWFPIDTSRTSAIHYQSGQGLPTYFFELPHGTFYGLPSIDGKTVKVAEHSGGQSVDNPIDVNREMHDSDLCRLRQFIAGHLPGLRLDPTSHSVCLYTMTPDQHFVVDSHPDWRNVAFAAGFSGHGFKFAPVIGEALADLALEQRTRLPIEFLSLARLS